MRFRVSAVNKEHNYVVFIFVLMCCVVQTLCTQPESILKSVFAEFDALHGSLLCQSKGSYACELCGTKRLSLRSNLVSYITTLMLLLSLVTSFMNEFVASEGVLT